MSCITTPPGPFLPKEKPGELTPPRRVVHRLFNTVSRPDLDLNPVALGYGPRILVVTLTLVSPSRPPRYSLRPSRTYPDDSLFLTCFPWLFLTLFLSVVSHQNTLDGHPVTSSSHTGNTIPDVSRSSKVDLSLWVTLTVNTQNPL